MIYKSCEEETDTKGHTIGNKGICHKGHNGS